MQVAIENRQKDLKLYRRPLKNLVEVVLSLYIPLPDLVELSFVCAREMRALHSAYFDDPTDTDAIAFPIDPKGSSRPHVLGQLVVCPKTALLYAKKNGKNPYEEVSLYLVHALLHCLGYDDLEAKKRKEMRTQEALCLEELQKRGIDLSEPNRKGKESLLCSSKKIAPGLRFPLCSLP